MPGCPGPSHHRIGRDSVGGRNPLRVENGRADPFHPLLPSTDRTRHPARIDPLLEAVPGPVDPPPTTSTLRSPSPPFVPPKQNCESVKGPLSTALRRIGAGQLLGTKGNICSGCDGVNS